MFGFYADDFANQFSHLYVDYNGRPFNVDDYYAIQAIKETEKSIAAGYMRRTSVKMAYVTQANQAFHVLGLNCYCVKRNLLGAGPEIETRVRSFQAQVKLDGRETKNTLLRMLLPIAGMYAHETFFLAKTYGVLKREWTRFFNSGKKIEETIPDELIRITKEEVPTSSPTLDKMRYILLGLGRQQPFAILVHERRAVRYLMQKLGEGATQSNLLALFSEIMKHAELISKTEFDNFVENHNRYYSRLKGHRQVIEEMIQIEARQANYRLSREELNRLTDSLIG